MWVTQEAYITWARKGASGSHSPASKEAVSQSGVTSIAPAAMASSTCTVTLGLIHAILSLPISRMPSKPSILILGWANALMMLSKLSGVMPGLTSTC